MEENNFGQQPVNGYEGVNVTLPPQKQSKKGLAIASLILGILSIVGLCCCCVNVITAPLAIIFGIIVLCKHMDGTGLAVTGIVTSVLSLLVVGGVFFSVRGIMPYSEQIANDYMQLIAEQDEVFPAYEEDGTLPDYLEKYTETPYTEMLEKYDLTFYDVMDVLLEQYKLGALKEVYVVSGMDSEYDLTDQPEAEMGILLPA